MDQELKDILQGLVKSMGRLVEGQSETNQRLAGMDKRFDGVDERINNLGFAFSI